MKATTARAIAHQRAVDQLRAQLELRLYQLHVPLPKRAPWDDDVTYNNTLLEACEEAEEQLAGAVLS